MENSYGIGVANRYALFLDDESDPLETLTLKEQEKELKKKTKGAEKENKGKPEAPAKPKPATPAVPGPKKPPKEQKTVDNKREDAKPRAIDDPAKPRNLKFNNNNENREDRNNRRNREDKFIPLENKGERVERPPRREGSDNFENRNKGERRENQNRDGRAIGNKPGGPRGPRRTFDDRRGKREFDRQSGSDKTGVKPVDKREGGGSHNWGSHKDIIEEADRPTDSEPNWGGDNPVVSPEGPAPEQPKEGVEGSTEAEPTAVEEEPKELTLDEWKAQRAGRSKPTYNIRKAGEGEDPSQWKKMYELKKRENEQDSDEDDEYDTFEYPQRVGRQKHLLEIDIQFNDSRRPGGGRGGRGGQRGAGGGGPRGGGNRGANPRGPRPEENRPERRFRNEEQQQPGGGMEDRTENRRAPKVDDERDFPSLG